MLNESEAPNHIASSVARQSRTWYNIPTAMPSCASIAVGELHSRPAEGGIPEVALLVPVLAVDNPVVDRTDLAVERRIAAGLGVDHRSLPVVGRIVLGVGLHNPDPEADHRSLLVGELKLTRPSYRMMRRYYRATI